MDTDTLAGTERLIERWLAWSPAERERLSHNARHCFAQRFHIERTAESFVEAMELFGMRRRPQREAPAASLAMASRSGPGA